MTFVHPLLMGGLLLVGLPVLIHLIMRQKPKRLPFPAFRFLLQKHRTNQTRLRLRHLLLLLLRMAVIAALCLALVRPALTGGVLPVIGGDRPVNAVLLIDTSYSMEYAVGGKTRLDEAKRRAGELLDELPDGSKVAVLDSAKVGGEWLMSAAAARDQVAGLKLSHVNAALPRQIEQAYRLFAEEDRAVENPAEARPNVLYVFSDRTLGCWDVGAAKGLTQPPGVNAVFVDVGTEDPADLAIVEVKPEPATARPGDTVRINVTVRATGADYDAVITCAVDGKPPETKSQKVQAGRAVVVPFQYQVAGPADGGVAQDGLAEGLHQVEVRLLNSDALPFDNVGFATFRVIEARPVLVLVDDRNAAAEWKRRLTDCDFRPEVWAVADANAVKLNKYAIVWLVNATRPDPTLWGRLKDYVAKGHGLAVVLGGPKGEPKPAAYNDEAAADLLPARLETVQQVADDKQRLWTEFEGAGDELRRHPILARFRKWKGQSPSVDFFEEALKPRASRFWKVTPVEGKADVLTHYSDKDASPALLERVVGRGRVLMLTTALDPDAKEWNQYFGLSSFGFSLTYLLGEYLAGDAEEQTLNYVTGQAVPVPLPDTFLPTYTLTGPGVLGSDATLTRQPEQRELRVVNATVPGNFSVLAVDEGRAARLAAFSLNPRPDEYQLDRVPAEQIEALLGEGSVLPIGRTTSLRDRLQERWAQPVELAPWLLIALLLFLAVESLLANRFYRRPAGEPEEPALGGVPEGRAGLRPAAKQEVAP
jgi:hypothetical protein